MTLGDGAAVDTSIVFDGNAQDFYIGLDDSADDLIIGQGSTVGSNPAIAIDENQNVAMAQALSVTGNITENSARIATNGRAVAFSLIFG